MQHLISEDPELLRLQGAELAARQRFERLGDFHTDPEAVRHAKEIWLEALAAVSNN